MAKDEGVIDKAFFNQVVASKAPNVTLVDVRTKFEFAAGNFAVSRHISINDVYSEGCPSTMARLPLISRTDCGSACGSNSSIRVMPAPGCTSVTRYRRRGRARN